MTCRNRIMVLFFLPSSILCASYFYVKKNMGQEEEYSSHVDVQVYGFLISVHAWVRSTYILTTWQVVLFWKKQSQVTAFANSFGAVAFLQFDSPLQGSTPKFQSVFPNVFAISLKTSTRRTQHPKTEIGHLVWYSKSKLEIKNWKRMPFAPKFILV